MPRGLLNVPDCALMQQDGKLLVNLYFPGSAKVTLENGNSVSLKIDGAFLTEGKVELLFQAEQPLQARLRVPKWSRRSLLLADGKTRELPAGEYAEIQVPAGKSSFSLEFDNSAVIHDCQQDVELEKLPPWYELRYRSDGETVEGGPQMTKEQKTVISAGPLILARSKMSGNKAEEMFRSPSIHGQDGQNCRLTSQEKSETLAAFSAEITTEDGRQLQTPVCDYASAGNVPDEDNELFSVFF
jgi:hypothetical protein